MKDSGIDWIGGIPVGWRCLRNKYFTSPVKSPSKDGTEALLSVTEKHGVVPRENVKNFSGNLSRSESLVGYLQVKPNFLVSNIMLMWKRGLGVSRYKGIVSPAYSVFEFNDKAAPRYFDYLFRSDMYISEFRRNSTGIIMSRLRLYDDSFGAIFSHFPPLEEQKRISGYLDQKTQQIDELIEKTEKKIELLKEQRTAMINHCVTKGLNPNVEMKDSGIEWIGQIPKNYNTTRIRYLCHIKTGGRDKQDSVEDGEYPFFVRSPNIEKIDSWSFDGEAVLTSGDGAGVGKIFHYYEGKFDFHQRVYKLSKFNRIKGKYFFWFLRENFYHEILRWNAKSTVDSIRLPLLQNFPMVVPPIEEQKQIADYLDQKTQQIDTVVEKEEKRISLLKEYRQSLISSAVTGKIKITEAMV